MIVVHCDKTNSKCQKERRLDTSSDRKKEYDRGSMKNELMVNYEENKNERKKNKKKNKGIEQR